MTIHRFCIGIDVSKRHLDVFDERRRAHRRVANTPETCATLAADAGAALVVFEATGAYDRALAAALDRAGIACVRVNPARARDFARAAGRLAKTDRLDAASLAAMGRALALAPDAPANPARARLARLHKRRDQLVDARAAERTRGSETGDPDGSLGAHIAWLTAEIARIESLAAALIGETPELRAAARLLESAPGVGPVTAATLIALMPELGQTSGKAVAALAGLAPMNRDSGESRGQRRISGGRRRVRRALYMAAVTAVRTSARLRSFYKTVLGRRGAAKIALIAVARKLLVTLNAMLKTNTAYQP